MASSQEFAEWIAEQLSGSDEIRIRKMFGEYGVYRNGIYFGAVCDNRFLVKVTEAGRQLLPEAELALPYEGGKPMLLIEDVDNRELMRAIAEATCTALMQKPGKTSRKRGQKSETGNA